MKKIFFPALLLVAAMSSCSENDVEADNTLGSVMNGEDYISLNVAAAGTRGVDIKTSDLQISEGVLLHIKDADGSTDDAYMFKYTASDWGQSGTSATWDDIKFPATVYSMHDGEAKTLTVGSGSATLSYTANSDVSKQNDLVYHSSLLTAIPSGGAVKAYHNHALSKVNFLAGTGSHKVYIAKVTLKNVDGNGDVTISPDAIKWTNDDSDDVSYLYYAIGSDKPEKMASTATVNPVINTAPEASILMIPQTVVKAVVPAGVEGGSVTPTGTYVEVIYYLQDGNGEYVVGYPTVGDMPDAADYVPGDQDKALYVKSAFPLGRTFTADNQYNIVLGLGMTGSTGGKLVDDFYVDSNGDKVDLTRVDGSDDKDIPEIKPGDDVLGGSGDLIDIVVNVVDWSNNVEDTVL